MATSVDRPRDSFGDYSILTGYEGRGGCFWCGGPFPDKRRRRFCGEKCRQEYDRHFFWPVAAAWCLERAGYKCYDCGVKGLRLVAHHIKPLDGQQRTYNILNRPENLVALCPSCHGKRHSGMNREKAAKPFAGTERGRFTPKGIVPLPGWEWLHEHYGDPYPEPTFDLSIDGRVVSLTNYKKGAIKALMHG